MGLAVGTKLGPYEIQAPLGAGGMGEVYRACDTILKREVAIKILPNSYSSDPERLRRFQQEAEAAAALNHPNILTIHQVGQQDGTSFIVTELLQGDTLREKFRGGPLPVRTAIDYSLQIAHGLAASHEKGIVHRDLKPENLFVTKDGRIKILDFGLAKLTQPQVSSGGSLPTISERTTPGAVMGTVGYMSPEQVRGQAADPRSDIFAFGAVLFEMLTGKRAFQGATSADTMSAILNQDPPLSQLTSNPTPGLQRVITRCLEKNPEQRFHSAADLAFAIEALSDLTSATQHAAPERDSHSSWATWAVPAALVLVAALVFVVWYLRRSFPAPGSGANSPSLDVRALTESGKTSRVAATPDGRYVAYVSKDAGQSELRLLQVATDRDVQVLPGSPNAILSLHFSPDGNFIYFLRELDPHDPDALGVFRIATLGGPATPLVSDARMCSVTVSPDGKQIAYIAQTQTESQIVAIDADGANRHILAKRPLALGFWFIEWSPSPDTLAAVAIGKEDMGLVSVELPAGSIRELSVSGWGAIGQPAWSPDAASIFAPAVSAGQSTMQIWAFDARAGTHRPLTSGSTDYLEFTLSATGTGDLIAATVTPAITLWATDHSAQSHPIPSLRGEGSESVIWVDSRIVTSNITEMMVHDPDGRNPTKLHAYSSIYRQLARCGPGQVVYWAAEAKLQSHIARTDISTGSASPLTDGPLDGEPTCTVDGSTLVFVHCTDQGSRCSITRKTIASGQSIALHDFGPENGTGSVGSVHPIISPDGSEVLFQEVLDAKDPYVWAMVVPIGGGNVRKMKMPVRAGEVIAYTWAPDGKSILYARTENGIGNIWSAPTNGQAIRKLTAFDSDAIFAFDVSPDNRLVISRGSWVRDAVLIKNAR